MTTVVGADISLKHGALVTLEGEILLAYTGRKGMDVTADELWSLACELHDNTPYKAIIAVDFDRDSCYWGGGRSPQVSVLITLLVGFYTALVRSKLSCSVHLVTPALVRDCLGVHRTTSKSGVHDHIKNIVPTTLFNDLEGDNWDAWILAHTLTCSTR